VTPELRIDGNDLLRLASGLEQQILVAEQVEELERAPSA
jgi:hypothetical protein